MSKRDVEELDVEEFVENENKKVKLQDYNDYEFKNDKLDEIEKNNEEKHSILMKKIDDFNLKTELLSNSFLELEKKMITLNNNLCIVEKNIMSCLDNVNNNLILNKALLNVNMKLFNQNNLSNNNNDNLNS